MTQHTHPPPFTERVREPLVHGRKAPGQGGGSSARGYDRCRRTGAFARGIGGSRRTRQLSADMTRLLMLVIEAQRGLLVESATETGGHRFRTVIGNGDGEEPSIVHDETSEIVIARAIFATAAENNTRWRIRLYDGSIVIDETKKQRTA